MLARTVLCTAGARIVRMSPCRLCLVWCQADMVLFDAHGRSCPGARLACSYASAAGRARRLPLLVSMGRALAGSIPRRQL